MTEEQRRAPRRAKNPRLPSRWYKRRKLTHPSLPPSLGYLPNDREVAAYGIKLPGGPGPVTAFSLAQEKGRLAKMWGGRKE
jgi:hypothetical protein